MNICKDFTSSLKCSGLNATVTLGTFDGVHLGHQYILKHVIATSRQTGIKSTVVTFDRHPDSVLNPNDSPELLTTLEEKLALFEEIGIDITCIISFTKQVADMTAEQFIKKYLIDNLGMSHFIVGYDHGFGKEREGSTEKLQKISRDYNFSLEIKQPYTYNGMIVKSSTIRNYLADGKVHSVSELLGRDHSFRGNVVPGHGIGKKIGIPTANIAVTDKEKVIPSSGVYAGWIEFKETKKEAVVSVGASPTFNREDESIEVHIPGYESNLYGENIRVGFTRKLRDIEKFESHEALTHQIKKDIEMLKLFILS